MAREIFKYLLAQCGSLSKTSTATQSRRNRSSVSSLFFEQLESRQLLAANPIISEFMASNDGTLLDEDGASSDWIEIHNAGDAAVDLGGWSLTDDSLELTKWSFPSTTLDANQSLLVFASGKDRTLAGSELHANFKLSAGGEYLALVQADGSTIAFDYAPEYPSQFEDVSYGLATEVTLAVLVDDTTLVRTLVPTDGTLETTWTNPSFDDSGWQGGPSITAGVGFEGSPTSETSYSSLINAPLTPLPTGLTSAYARFEFQLNSVADINQLSLAMQFDDGFAAYLNGVPVASANAPASPIWNSTATGQTPDDQATNPVNFDLTNHLDELVVGTNVLSFQLLNRTAGSSDLLLIPELIARQSTIIEPFELGYFADPTPGEPNGSNALGFTSPPTFSVPRGFYESTFDVTLTTETPGSSVYYTTDGSEPSETNGILYTGPVTVAGTTPLRAAAIKDDFFPSPSVTHTYLFAADVIAQSSSPAGYPSDWGTHNNFTSGNTPFTAVADYEIDPDVVGPGDLFNGVYTSRFEEALTSLPTLSLTMDIDDAFDANTGFYANSILTGRDWERETSVEWWDPADESQFQANAGIRAHGGAGRQPWRTPKHAMRLYFRNEYGPGRLNFPLFGEEGVTRFDRLVLRSHYNDSWQAVSSALHNRAQYIQDPFVRNTFGDMGNLSVRSRPSNVYINGLYWGIYDLTERPDSEYFADHLGGDADDYDVITHGGLADGNRTAWDDLFSFVRTTDLSSSAGYEAVKQQLDVQNLVDYMLANFYAGTDDWPHNNWVTAANRVAGGGFKFYVWDAEISMNRLNSNRTDVDDANSPAELYDRLRVNSDFRQLFADRALLHLSEGGALTPAPSAQRYSDLASLVEPALVAESARWGDVHETVPRTVDDQWQDEVDFILDTYIPQRTDVLLSQLQAGDLASNLAAPEFGTPPGQVPSGANVALVNNQAGATLYYTLDGTDPRDSGGAVSGSAIIVSGPVSITAATTITMRVLSGGDWSGIVSGSFLLAEPVSDFGDAPASYSTLLANDGARHAAIGPQLGASRDSETDGAPSSLADGDGSDEDGALFGGIGVNNLIAAVNIELGNASEAKVDGWIDFNRDGVWDASEKILNSVVVDQPMQTLNYNLPAGLTTGDAYARVRISTSGGLSPNGLASDGEVEDYVVSIAQPPTVERIEINADDPQRSSLDTVRVTFDRVVDVSTSGGDPFKFTHTGSGDVVTTYDPVIDHSGGKTTVDFTFDHAGLHVTSFGSLEDGNYHLMIDPSLVTHLGVELDGDGDGTSGDAYVMSAVDGFFRKYGDANGDGSVGLTDFAAFRGTFGRSLGQAGYHPGLDSDGDQTIGLSDFASFRSNFGQ